VVRVLKESKEQIRQQQLDNQKIKEIQAQMWQALKDLNKPIEPSLEANLVQEKER
jgi:hypothetical protein